MDPEELKKLMESLNSQANAINALPKAADLQAVKSDVAKNAADAKAATDKIAADLKAATDSMKAMESKVNMISVKGSSNASDPKRGFKNSAEFFNAVIVAGMNENRPDKMPENLRALFNAVGSDEARSASNPDGGFLIPPEFMPGVMQTNGLDLQNDTGLLTRKVPMSSPVVEINARVDKDHSSSVSGGFRVYRRSEAAAVAASKGSFEQVKLEAHALMGLSYATEEILSRSPISFAALIQSGFADEKSGKLNYERIWGTGVGEFLGFINSPALVTVAKEANQTADTINGLNIVKMRARAYRYSQCVWMANQDALPQLMAAHVSGTNGDVFLFAPGNGVDKPDTLLGRPVIFDENAATLGELGDLSLVNWNEYLEGQLGGPSFEESIHVRFETNERAFRFNIYNDGAPWWRSPLTPKKSAVTLSPFVALQAR